MKLYDQNGDECQMSGLPHMFYDKVAVDSRIAELEKALRRIVEIPNEMVGGDWDEIEQAREIAREALRL